MGVKQNGAISTQMARLNKYWNHSHSSAASFHIINQHLVKAWNAIEAIYHMEVWSINERKRNLTQAVILSLWMHHTDVNKLQRKENHYFLECYVLFLNESWWQHPDEEEKNKKKPQLYGYFLLISKKHSSRTKKTCRSLVEKHGETNGMLSCGQQHTDMVVLVNQQGLSCISVGQTMEDWYDSGVCVRERKRERGEYMVTLCHQYYITTMMIYQSIYLYIYIVVCMGYESVSLHKFRSNAYIRPNYTF